MAATALPHATVLLALLIVAANVACGNLAAAAVVEDSDAAVHADAALQASGMSASKLSLHSGLGSASMGFVKSARPQVIKVLDAFDKAPQLKQMVPGIFVVGRVYLATQPTDGDPIQRADEWWGNVNGTILGAAPGSIDVFEGYNEINTATAEQMAWYASFEAERVKILAAHGLKAAIGSFSVGWPDVTNATLMRLFYPAIDAAIANGGVLGLHEYSSPLLSSCFDNATNSGWTTGRYRHWYELYLKPTNRVIPLVISECGISNAGCPSSGLGGWLSHCDLWKSKYGADDCAAFYVQQLAWYDTLLRADDYVKGATIFQCDCPGWADKDVTTALPQLTSYMNGVSGRAEL